MCIFCDGEILETQCRLCGGDIISLYREGEAVDGLDWCEDCGAFVDLINFALDSKREILNLDDLDQIKKLVSEIYGEFSDKTTKVIIDGEDVGYLNKFILKCVYDGYGSLVKHKGMLVDREFKINSSKEIMFKTIRC